VACQNVSDIDACLPQTQCQRCSYPCCQDYATAISRGEANINQCPPGGDITIKKLAALCGMDVLPLDSEFGEFQPKTLAYIFEEKCIGCVLCIKVCPVDAIMGANKLMHTVIETYCTGCELCLPVCPTDCIEMRFPAAEHQLKSDWPGYTEHDIVLGRDHFKRRQRRLSRQARGKATPIQQDAASRQRTILDAVKRKQQESKKL
jgi:electron transport complex protein RnfB